jgi:hypothetical protein
LWKTAEVHMDGIMFSYFSPVSNNNINVNGINWVEIQFDQIIDEKFFLFVNTQETFQRMKYKRIFFNLTEFSV